MTPRKHDDLFAGGNAPEKFEFNESVARVFDNMLERSIPFYKECLGMVVALVQQYARPGTRVFDLGCSTGNLIRELARAIPEREGIRFVGIDNSPAMLKKARRKLKAFGHRCELVEADLNGPFSLDGAGVVVMNYTLQFIPPQRRKTVLARIQRALPPGGALILIEKVQGESTELDSLFIGQYYRYKREKGYSRMEIARKREALEEVLVPLKPSENVKIMQSAGFGTVDVFFKWFNFAGFVALPDAPTGAQPAAGKKPPRARKSR